MSTREFDIVVWGATGFTGRLVAEYLLKRYGPVGELRWALGGRNSAKLEAVRSELGAEAIPLVVGDGDDEAFLSELAERTHVVCTTVGPYAKYGTKLVAACAGRGTHYCDLTGEVQWMSRVIEAHQKDAEASGARIVHTCGFDSIPSDLGVFFLQREMRARHGSVCGQVKYRSVAFEGGFSGGSVATMLNMLEEAGRDPSVRRILADPYALDPSGEPPGPDGPDRTTPFYDPDFGQWTGPFVMAGVNTRVVRRSNALLGYPYGRDFRYDEATLMGSGPAGWLKAAGLCAGLGTTMLAGAVGPLRRALTRFLPAPGEGPSEEAREKGYFEIALFGSDGTHSLRARVTGDRDPGYGSTAKMLGESAVCLAKNSLSAGGGFWTPASVMGEPLLTRLQANAGLTFTIEED